MFCGGSGLCSERSEGMNMLKIKKKKCLKGKYKLILSLVFTKDKRIYFGNSDSDTL